MVGAHNPMKIPNCHISNTKNKYDDNTIDSKTHNSNMYSDVVIFRLFIYINELS